MADRAPGRLRRVVMAWVTLTFVLAWLPLVRSVMDGPSYQWGTRFFGASFSGAGLGGDLWLLVAQSALGLWLLYRGWRRPESPFPIVLLVWLGLVAANSLYAVLTAPELYRFEGATLGVDVSLALVAPVLSVGFFLLAALWAYGRRERSTDIRPPGWGKANKALLGAAVLLFPLQLVLLRIGRGQEAEDVIGVLLTIGQWLLISAAFYPWGQGARGRTGARALAGRAALLLGLCVPLGAVAAGTPAMASEPGAVVGEASLRQEFPPQEPEEVRFRNGDLTLGGLWFVPEGEGPFPAAVFIRGSGPSTRDNYWTQRFVDLLVDEGVAVLLPDKRGSDASQGDWRTADFEDLAGDALAAVTFAGSRPEVDGGRVGLIGLSQGGKIAPIAASRSDAVAFVIDVVGAATDLKEQVGWEMYHTFREAGVDGAGLQGGLALQVMAEGYLEGTVDWGSYEAALREALSGPGAAVARGFPQTADAWQWDFFRGVMDFDPLPYWRQVRQPVLVLYGESDHNAPSIRSAYRLLRAWRDMGHPDATLRVIPGTGHPLWEPNPANPHRPALHPEVVGTLRDWLARVAARASREENWKADVAAFARRVIDAGLAPGLGVAVARGDRVVFTEGFGSADLETGRHVDAETPFYIASSTKSLTALATVLLAERGELDLKAPIGRYLPDLRLREPLSAEAISVEDLLTLTHGIADGGPVVFRTAFSGEFTREGLLALLAEYPPSDAGRSFVYGNLGYNLLGLVLESVAGTGWKEVVAKEVLGPLGMDGTTAYVSRLDADRLAWPHGPTPDGFERVPLGKADANLHAAGGHLATARDLARYLAAHQSGGRLEGRQALPAEAVLSTHRPHVPQDREFGPFRRFAWGYGWDLGVYEADTLVHRFGAFAGYRSHMSFMPRERLGVVVLTNGSGPASPATDLLATYIYDRLRGRADADSVHAARLAALEIRAADFRARLADQLEERQARRAPLPHPPSHYAGVYENPTLGRMIWRVEEGGLVVRMGVAHSPAEVFEPSSHRFRVELTGGGEVVEFSFSEDGGSATALRYRGETFSRSGDASGG